MIGQQGVVLGKYNDDTQAKIDQQGQVTVQQKQAFDHDISTQAITLAGQQEADNFALGKDQIIAGVTQNSIQQTQSTWSNQKHKARQRSEGAEVSNIQNLTQNFINSVSNS